MSRARVLAVDDEKSMRDLLAFILRKEGFEADVASNRAEVERLLSERHYALVITDVRMPGLSGIDVLKMVRHSSPETRVILITAYASAETAIEAMKLGAYEYITKPFKVEDMKALIRSAVPGEHEAPIPREVRTEAATEYLVGDSRGILEICKVIGRVANRKITVLITGESGTGKELIARAIHANSDRKERPFVTVNCGALTDTLLESELFGHMKGSFTGAVGDRKGLFEAATGGTLFLDEIGETSKNFQVKLLRAIQEEKIMPVGDTRDRSVDVRIVAATNRDLERLIREGAFREDLFYRLNVISLRVPPLRERVEDIPKLAEYFLKKYDRGGDDPVRFAPETMELLVRHRWPGNVRELENVIERAVAVESGKAITPASLPPILTAGPESFAAGAEIGNIPSGGFDLQATLDGVELGYLERALERTGGNRQEAARLLGISLRSLRYRLAKFKRE